MKTLTDKQYNNSVATLIRNCIYYSDSSLDNRADLYYSSLKYLKKNLLGKQLLGMTKILNICARLYLKLKV